MRKAALPRIIVAISLVMGVLAVGAIPGSALASSISLSPSSATVAPGGQTTLVAGMPVVGSGSLNQQIVQQIDPTKVKLTSLSDISYPSGWTLSFCSGVSTDCTNASNFSATVPSTPTAWAAVKAVKAQGQLVSEGSLNGRQVIQKSFSNSTVSLAPSPISSTSAGDGFQAFFDPGRTRVFNVFHHSAGPILDCHVIATGATCAGFPFDYGGQSKEAAYGIVVGTKIWLPSNFNGIGGLPTGLGMRCVNIAAVLSSGGSPQMCSTPYVSLGSNNAFPTHFTNDPTSGVAGETKLYLLSSTTPNAVIYCLNTATAAACSSPSISLGIPGNATGSNDGSDILKSGDLIYVSVADDSSFKVRLSCVLASTGSLCPGWTAGRVTISNGSTAAYLAAGKLFELPDAAGGTRGVCYQSPALADKCWAPDGTEFAAATYNVPRFTDMTKFTIVGSPVRQGSRVFFGNTFWSSDSGGEFWCYDATENGGAGGRCNGATTNYAQQNYTVTPDPSIANCVWIGRHNAPVLQTFNLLTGTDGCADIAPRRAVLSGQTVVPRMGCSSTNAINSWKSFILDSPTTGFTTAKLTVQTASGSSIANWTDVSLTPGVPLDLSALSTSDSGQTPTFVVDIIGASGSVTPTARLSAVGDAPQLCLNVTALATCPSGSGQISPSSLGPTTAGFSATGTSSDGTTTTTLDSASSSVTVSAMNASQCGSTLTGTATLTGTSTPVAGATVTLLDSSGNPVLDSQGNPVTTTTASDGTYSFGYLYPGNYKVKFSDSGVKTADTATITSGGSSSVSRGDCSSGTATTVATNLSWITSPDAGVRTAPTNLITNGDFTDTNTFTTPPHLFWGEKTVQGTARMELTASVMGYPIVPYPNAVSTGVNGEAIPGWIAAGGGVRTYAMIGPLPNRGTTLGLTPNIVYFGNGQSTSVSPSVTWTAQGWSRQSLTVSNSNSEYGTSAGLTLSQTIATTVGVKYRFQFHQLAEQAQVNDGIAAIDITGYGRTFFAVKQATRRIALEFVATATSTMFTFVAWGHLPLSTELAIDDVTVNPCTTDVTSGATSIAIGTNAVVNATYDTAALATADTSTGAQGVAQTISVKTNDTASTGANLTSPTINFCTSDNPATGCTLTTKTVSGQGVYTISGGNVVFTPCSGSNTPAGAGCTGAFTGTATPIAYQITDSAGSKSTSTITPTVIPTPSVANDTSSGAYNTAQSKNILANDSAGTGATLNTSSIRLCDPTTTPAQTPNNCTVTAGQTISVPNVGTYSVNSSGVITFTPAANFSGTAPALRYQVQDSLGQYGSGTFTPTVAPPAPPTAFADTSTGLSGATQTINPLSNDVVGASGVTFTASSVKLCSAGQTSPNCTATSLVVPGEGTYSVNGTTGAITFTPCSGVNTPAGASCTGAFGGTATPVTYQVSTNTNQTTSATYTAKVIPPPVVVPDSGTGNWDNNQLFNPLQNDTAGSGTTLTAVPAGICAVGTAVSSCTGSSVTINGVGTYTLNTTTGVVTFDPLPSFTGQATPVQYVASDALGQKSATTITPTVTPPPEPSATPQEKVVAPGGTATFTTLTGTGGLASTGGPSFNTSATCLITPGSNPATCDADGVVAIPGEGTYTLNTTTGVVTFVAAAGATPGTKTAITYRVSDATGQTATSTLTPIVPPPPTLSNDASVNEQNATQILNVMSNDSASAYTSLSSNSVKLCPQNATSPYNASNCNLSSLTVPDEGVYTVNANGTVSFVPCNAAPSAACPTNPGVKYSGVATPVRYVAQDNLGQFGSALITPTVLPPPVAQAANDSRSALFAQPVVFSPLTNDSGGTTTGLVGYTSTGTASLTPSSVRLCSSGESAPNCTATNLTTVDGTYVVNTNTGSITFTPATNFAGTPANSPSYMVCNSIGGNWQPMAPPSSCASALVTPTIAPPVSPTAVNDISTGAYNTPQTINVLNNDTKDPALTFVNSSVKLCGAGQTPPNCTMPTLTVSGEGVYTVNQNGTISFVPFATFTGTVLSPPTYQVADSFGNKVSATITPTVTPPPMPVASPETKSVVPGSTATFTNVIGTGSLSSGTAIQSGIVAGPCIIDPSDQMCKATFTIQGEGTWTVDQSTGAVTFAADNSVSSGTKTPVLYRVTDITGQTATSTLTPVVPPVATPQNDVNTDLLDVNQVVNVLSNDAPGTGTSLIASSVRLCSANQAAPLCTQISLTVIGEGTFTVNSDGTITFDPESTFVGTASPVSYQVTDSLGRVATATMTPKVITDPPVASPETITLAAGSSAVFKPIFGASGLVVPDQAGAPLVSNSVCIVDPSTNICGTSVTIPGEGTFSLNVSTGVVTYTSLSSATAGNKTSVVYRISDTTGYVSSQILTPIITVKKTTDAVDGTSNQISQSKSSSQSGSPSGKSKPKVVNQHAYTKPSIAVYLNPSALGHPSNGSQFNEKKTRLWDATQKKWAMAVTTTEGTWVVINDNVRFISANGFLGRASIPFRMTDHTSQSASAVLTVLVTEKMQPLPATGLDTLVLMQWGIFALFVGFLCMRRRRSTLR